MTIERANPLPPNTYWISVFGDQRSTFSDWLHRNAASVHVTSTESHDPQGSYPAEDFYVFKVLQPTKWEGPGLPTIAPAGTTSTQDVTQHPDYPANIVDNPEAFLPSSGSGKALLVIAGAAVAGIALLALTRRSTPTVVVATSTPEP